MKRDKNTLYISKKTGKPIGLTKDLKQEFEDLTNPVALVGLDGLFFVEASQTGFYFRNGYKQAVIS